MATSLGLWTFIAFWRRLIWNQAVAEWNEERRVRAGKTSSQRTETQDEKSACQPGPHPLLMWEVYKLRDLPALLILIIQLDMSPRTLNPSLMWEGEWQSPCAPPPLSLSPWMVQAVWAGVVLYYCVQFDTWVWLMVFRCNLVRKLIILSLRSHFQLVTMWTHCLRCLPWSTDCPLSQLHGHAAKSLQKTAL